VNIADVNESIILALVCKYDCVKLHSKTDNAFLRHLISRGPKL
jgi:hypothetical protein